MAGFAFAQLLWGPLSDRLGRKPVLLIGLTLFALGCVRWEVPLEQAADAHRLMESSRHVGKIVFTLPKAGGTALITGGLGAHYGAERLGCTVVPVSGGMTERQVDLIRDFGARIIMVTPSYFLAILDESKAQ